VEAVLITALVLAVGGGQMLTSHGFDLAVCWP